MKRYRNGNVDFLSFSPPSSFSPVAPPPKYPTVSSLGRTTSSRSPNTSTSTTFLRLRPTFPLTRLWPAAPRPTAMSVERASPTIAVNWEADRDDRWLVPVGGGAGKVSKIGGQLVGVALETFYHAVSPDVGPDWQLRFQLTFGFPK